MPNSSRGPEREPEPTAHRQLTRQHLVDEPGSRSCPMGAPDAAAMGGSGPEDPAMPHLDSHPTDAVRSQSVSQVTRLGGNLLLSIGDKSRFFLN